MATSVPVSPNIEKLLFTRSGATTATINVPVGYEVTFILAVAGPWANNNKHMALLYCYLYRQKANSGNYSKVIPLYTDDPNITIGEVVHDSSGAHLTLTGTVGTYGWGGTIILISGDPTKITFS